VTDVFSEHRSTLFAVAYRMTGSVEDADDIVQDAWIRWTAGDRADVQDPVAYLVRTVTNLALTRLTSARARRETYVGPWLPEPLLTVADGGREVELADDVSLAMLVVLENLSPLERAVFVLGDLFGYRPAEIAEVTGRTPAAVRQLAHRAREHVQARRPRFPADEPTRADVVRRFLAACAGGDLDALLEVLAPDVVAWSDGGGKVTAARHPIEGAGRVARWLLGVLAKPQVAGMTVEVVRINGEPAVLARSADRVLGSVHLEIDDGRITEARLVLNPDKLRGLGPRAGG
jgi:RNA polymerase sigma-70 factor (TIGR02957 family)